MTALLGVPEVCQAFAGIDVIGRDCRIDASVSVLRWGGDGQPALVLGDEVSLYAHGRLVLGDVAAGASIGIGDRVIVNTGCYLSGEGGLVIGSEVLIGAGVCLLSAGHDLDGPAASIWHNAITRAPVQIGDGAWIGARAVVLQGVSVGHGAVVAAGSVVTRDVPADAVVAGVPARRVRYRAGRAPPWWQRVRHLWQR